jgi:hypothetical protein
MILNPYFWVAIVMSWVVVAVSVYEHEQTEFDKERAVAQAALDAANKHSQEITDERNKTVAYISRSLADTQTKAAAASKALDDKLASGSMQLSVPVASCSAMPGDSPATGGNPEARANLDAGFSQSLVAITQRGDQAINQLNACIDAYSAIVKTGE